MAACTVIVCKDWERGREGERRRDKCMRVGTPPLTVCVLYVCVCVVCVCVCVCVCMCVGRSGEENE